MEDSTPGHKEPASSVQVDLSGSTRERDVEVIGRRLLACLLDVLLVALFSSVAFAPLLFVLPGLVLLLVLLLLFIFLFCIIHVIYIAPRSKAFGGGRSGRHFWG